jgi:protein-disulfide isomerase
MTSHPSPFFVSGALLLAIATGPAAGAAESSKVIATINGQAITEADVRAASGDQLEATEREYRQQLAALEHEHQQQLYDVIKNGLDQLIENKLVAAEAAARGVTDAAILAEIKTPAVTDADIDTFYKENQDRMTSPKAEMAARIKSYLEGQAQKMARDDYFDGLKRKFKVDIKLEPIRIAVAATGPAVGPANAPVTIVEFSDFQCPFCQRIAPTLDQIVAKYGDKVRIVFRQFPLTIHQDAAKAAEASLCANEQGKFWELHNAMFKGQNALKVEELKASAASLGLDSDAFGKCLDSGRTAATVQNDLKEGSAAGVNGTPALFINGRSLTGAVPLDEITTIIDDELRRHGG